MKKIILGILLLLMVLASFLLNSYVEKKLYNRFFKIKTENIQNLEHLSNKNFHKKGIENIGGHLQSEFIKMNINKCKVKVRKDYFFIFQDKVISIKNNSKCLKINTKYELSKDMFKIKGYESCCKK